MADVRALGSTFTPRQAPDAAAYVRRSISASPYRYTARVRYHAPQDAVAKVFSPTAVDIEPDGATSASSPPGADDPERMVLYLGMPGYEFEVLSPPEVIEAVRAVADRLSRAVAPM